MVNDFTMAGIISNGIHEHGLNKIVSILSLFNVSPGPQNGIDLSPEQRQGIIDLIREETFAKTGR